MRMSHKRCPEGQSGKNMCQGGKPDTGKFHSSYIGMNVCGSAYENGHVVDGMCARRQRIKYYISIYLQCMYYHHCLLKQLLVHWSIQSLLSLVHSINTEVKRGEGGGEGGGEEGMEVWYI